MNPPVAASAVRSGTHLAETVAGPDMAFDQMLGLGTGAISAADPDTGAVSPSL